jgi:hypothetical protein
MELSNQSRPFAGPEVEVTRLDPAPYVVKGVVAAFVFQRRFDIGPTPRPSLGWGF